MMGAKNLVILNSMQLIAQVLKITQSLSLMMPYTLKAISIYATDKYAINSAGEFYNVRQAWIQDEFYKGMIKLGVPEDVLDKNNPLGYSDLWLTNKYHYYRSTINAHWVLKLVLYLINIMIPHTPRNSLIKAEALLPATRFSCNAALIPSQTQNQG